MLHDEDLLACVSRADNGHKKKKKNNNIPTTKPNPSHLFLIKETKAVEHMLLHTLKLIGGSI